MQKRNYILKNRKREERNTNKEINVKCSLVINLTDNLKEYLSLNDYL